MTSLVQRRNELSYSNLLRFPNYNEASVAFALAANNGSGEYPGRLVDRLGEIGAANPVHLRSIIDEIQLGKPAVEKKTRSVKEYHRFSAETTQHGLTFYWRCEPREPGPGEQSTQERTVITLYPGNLVEVTSAHSASIRDRVYQAWGGKNAPFAHRRATGKV